MGLKRIMLTLLNSLPNQNMKEPVSKQDPIIQRVHFTNVGLIRNSYVTQYLWKIVQKYLHRWGFRENYPTLTSHNDIQGEPIRQHQDSNSVMKCLKQQNPTSRFSST
jgi:hypothetical protein